MLLDYNPARRLFALYVDRRDGLDVATLVGEYGLNFSQPASTAQRACLSTASPYAAATFAAAATPAARAQLAWITGEIDNSRLEEGTGNYDLPSGLELWGFQRANLDYIRQRSIVLVGDEPGLGKTPTAIVAANDMQAQRILCIVPASIRFQWADRILGANGEPGWWTGGWTHTVPNRTVYVPQKARDGTDPKAAWNILSYDLARVPGVLDGLRRSGRYDLLIVDEAHFAKTAGAKRSRTIFGGGDDPAYQEGLIELAEKTLFLSGTPMPNRPREIYTIARHADHGAIDYLSEDRFNATYNPINVIEVDKHLADGTTIRVRVNDEKSGRHAELQNRLRAHFMTRHEKRAVMKQLKYPVYDLIRLNPNTDPIRAALKAESLLKLDPDAIESGIILPEEIGPIAAVRHQMGLAAAPQVAKYVVELLAAGEQKVALFYWHIQVGAILEDLLRSWGVCRVDGRTTPLVKQALVDRFRRDPGARIMMGNILTLGTGTDGLQHVCNRGVIGEPDWVPGNNIQAFDRLDRGGQTRLVHGDICVVPGSLIERILVSALRKLRVTHNSLDRRL